jgi:hypothetical protein
MVQEVLEPARKIPVVGHYDVVVAGGGIAGVAAALAAARCGAKVALVEKECCLGGLATLGLIVVYLPLCDGRGNQVMGGIAEELLLASLRYGMEQLPACWRPDGDPTERVKVRYQVRFNPASLILALDDLIQEAGITTFFDTRLCAAQCSANRIEAILVENKSGRLALIGDTYVDASGDADLCYLAREETVSRADNRRSGWFYSYTDGRLQLHPLTDPLYGPTPPGSRTYAGDRWEDVTQLAFDGRRMALAKLQKLNAERSGDKVVPAILPALPLFRMTRRLRSSFELDTAHLGCYFPDTVGLTGDWRNPGPVYAVPYRSLAAVRNRNLLTAGRCISVSDPVWDVTRVIPTCALTGEAAGTAAALAVRTGTPAADLAVGLLQEQLRRQGAVLAPHLVSAG